MSKLHLTMDGRRSHAQIISRCALVAALLIAPVGLSACGTLVGAGVGGVAGSQFGKGNGKTAATIGGAILGGVAGHAITGN